MDNKTNVYTLDVSEKTFNDVQANKFYITDTKDLKAGDYVLFREVVKDEQQNDSYTGANTMLTVNTINDTFAGLEKGYSVVFLKQKVRKMNNMEKVFNTAVAILATFFTYLFGGWDLALKILIT